MFPNFIVRKASTQLIDIGVAVLVTAIITTVVKNFVSGEKKIRKRIPRQYDAKDLQFERSMSQLLGPPILGGNCVTSLVNGDKIFAAMLEGIESAIKTITFETFIYWTGAVSDKFAEARAAKARAGVRVHVLIDGVGCNCIKGNAVSTMRQAGVEVEVYHIQNLARANHRTHRKLLVIDGKLGFTGGVGIADQWSGDAKNPEHWRDTHYRVEGPVVAQLQAAFLDNWMKTRAVVLHGNDYFPLLEDSGKLRCQMFKSSPMEGSESARLMFLMSITAADQHIRIGNAYFVPDDLSIRALIDASQRGVKVEVIVPGDHLDSYLVRGASRHRWGNLLKEGIRIFEYIPTMYHCKLMIVDDLWVSVGSANFDNRSFRLNDEANLNIIDQEFAQTAILSFEDDKKRCREVTWSDWANRPMIKKVFDASTGILRSQL